jgi:hypothetical protein
LLLFCTFKKMLVMVLWHVRFKKIVFLCIYQLPFVILLVFLCM